MTVGEMKSIIKDLPDDMEVDIEVNHYDGGSITGGVIPHIEEVSHEDVEGYSVDKYFSLKCTIFM